MKTPYEKMQVDAVRPEDFGKHNIFGYTVQFLDTSARKEQNGLCISGESRGITIVDVKSLSPAY